MDPLLHSIIPLDLWPLIASFMDNKTKRQMRLANTTWFNIIRYNKFNIYFARSENIQAISERLSRYSWPIEICFTKSKFNNAQHVLDNLSIITNLTKISAGHYDVSANSSAIDWDFVTTDQWLKLSTLTNIQSWKLSERYLPIDLWTKFVKLTEWTVPLPSKEMEKILLQMTNLDSLNFFTSKRMEEGCLELNNRLGYNLTRITKLAALSVSQKDMVVWTHLPNLKVLRCSHYDKDLLENISYLTALENLSCYAPNAVPSLIMNTNLTKLDFHHRSANTAYADLSRLTNINILKIFDSSNRYSGSDPPYEFLAHLQQLKKLYLQGYIYKKEHIYPHLPISLTNLKLEVDIDMAQMTHLSNLQELKSNSVHNSQYMTSLCNLTYLHFEVDKDYRDLAAVGKMTKLRDLLVSFPGLEEQLLENNNTIDLSGLTNLTRLYWYSMYYPSVMHEQWMYLIGLRELCSVAVIEKRLYINDCNYLSTFTNLTRFVLHANVRDPDALWKCIEKLTKLEAIDLFNIDNDDRLLVLTAMKNLTEFTVGSGNEKFDGRLLTCLTNLQCIKSHKRIKLVHSDADLMNMPYLWSLRTS